MADADYRLPVPMKDIPSLGPQKILNGEVHNWYRIVLGYSDHLVGQILDRFDIKPGQKVIDPFCGTGTTLVECMKRGIDCVGVDANPSSCFSAHVKTNWSLKNKRLLELLEEIELKQNLYLRRKVAYKQDPTYKYLEDAGMIRRGWISPEPLRKALAIKSSIVNLATSKPYKNALMLALIAEVITGSSNVKFGPELYCGPAKLDSDVFSGFAKRVQAMAKDLLVVSSIASGKATVIEGDVRECDELFNSHALGPYAAVICSPPYPAEHDYTRNARLELAFLELVKDRRTLRSIKHNMIRSNTKNIYKEDTDSAYVDGHSKINEIAAELDLRIASKTHSFARLYPTVIREYFGGMKRHLLSLKNFLVDGAKCAYVVGDQSCYLQVHIPTAEILSSIAQEIGFKTLEIKQWRSRRSTATSKEIAENILFLQK